MVVGVINVTPVFMLMLETARLVVECVLSVNLVTRAKSVVEMVGQLKMTNANVKMVTILMSISKFVCPAPL